MKTTRERTRVVLFLRSLEIGGAEMHAYMLAEHLLRRGEYDVQAWTFSPGGLIGEFLEAKNVPIISVPDIPNGRLQKILGLTRLIRMLRQARPTLLLPFCDYPNKLCGAIWELTGACGCIWNQMDEGREITGKFLERRALRRSSLFVANSEEGRSFLRERLSVPDGKIRIIHNGVHLEEPALNRAGWRERLGVPERAFLAVMIANYSRFKDHPTLLRAWRIVQEQRVEQERPLLLLVGSFRQTEGELQALSRELGIEGSVIFWGQVKDLSGLLSACDLGVFSSKREGMPYAVLDCMLAKIPVVATGITGIREALGSEHPYYAPPDDPRQFAMQILRVMREPKRAEESAEAGYQRAATLFSQEAMGNSYEKVMIELLRRSQRGKN